MTDPFDTAAQVLARALRQQPLTVLVGAAGELGNRPALDSLLAQLSRRTGDVGRKDGVAPLAVEPKVERRKSVPRRAQRESLHVVTEWTEETLRGLFEQLDLQALHQRQLAGRVLFLFDDVQVPLEAGLQRFAESWTAALRAPHLDVGFLAAGDASIWPALQALQGHPPAWQMQGFRLHGAPDSPRLEPLPRDKPEQRHADDFTSSIEAAVRHAAESVRRTQSETIRFKDSLASMALRLAQAARDEDKPSPQSAEDVHKGPAADPAEEAAHIEAETATRAAAEAARRAAIDAEQDAARAALRSALDAAAAERQRADELAEALSAAESAAAHATNQARADIEAWRERAAAEWHAKAAETQQKQRHLEQALEQSQAARDSARSEAQALQDRVAALEAAAEAARAGADADLQIGRESTESQWRDQTAALQAQLQQTERSLAEAQAAREAAQAGVAQLQGRIAEIESTAAAAVAEAVDAARAQASTDLAAWRERAEAERSASTAQAQAKELQLQQALAGAEAAREAAQAEARAMQGQMQRVEADAEQARQQAAALLLQQRQLEHRLAEAQTARDAAQAEAQRADRRLATPEAGLETARMRADAAATAAPAMHPPPLAAAELAQPDPPRQPSQEPPPPAALPPQLQDGQALQPDQRPTEVQAAELPPLREKSASPLFERPPRGRRSILLWGGAAVATMVAVLLLWPGRQGADAPPTATPSVAMAPQLPASAAAPPPAAAPAPQPAIEPPVAATTEPASAAAEAAAQAPAAGPAASASAPAPAPAPEAAVAATPPSWPNRLELVAASDGGSHERIARELAQALSGAAPVTVVPPAQGDITLKSLGMPGRLAIVRHDELRAARASGSPSLQVLTPLFKEQVLFIVRADSKLSAIRELRGKRVALGSGGGPLLRDTLQRIVGAQLVSPAVDRDPLLAELVAFRTIDAIVVVGPQPSTWWDALPPPTARRLRLLTLEATRESDRRLLQAFGTSVSRSRAGASRAQRITTPAVMSYLVASTEGGPDAEGALQLTRQLCAALPQLRRDGHPVWKSLQPGAALDPGWPLMKAAQKTLVSCVARQR